MTLQQQKDIGIWCNGNTTDSGPVIPGSNPGIPTKSIFLLERCFFVLYNLAILDDIGLYESFHYIIFSCFLLSRQ